MMLCAVIVATSTRQYLLLSAGNGILLNPDVPLWVLPMSFIWARACEMIAAVDAARSPPSNFAITCTRLATLQIKPSEGSMEQGEHLYLNILYYSATFSTYFLKNID
jgi:hypothetical protein